MYTALFALKLSYGYLIIFASFVHTPWFLLTMILAFLVHSPDIINHMEAKIGQMAFSLFVHSYGNRETSY